MRFVSLLAVATLAVGVPLNLYVTGRLWRLWFNDRTNAVLRERAIAATLVLVTVLVFGLIFLNNDLPVSPVTFEDSKVFTRITILGLSVCPACYWLWLYR